MAYQILSAPHGTEDWQPCAIPPFATGREAAAHVATLKAASSDYRYKIKETADDPAVEVDDVTWRQREHDNFDSGRYIETPWHGCVFNDELRYQHFSHMSLTQPGKIAFTESPERGRQDRQTIMAPGRYLTRYFANVLSAAEIEESASEAALSGGCCELHVTQDADTIEQVYENGPSSCMAGEAGQFSGPCHPVRVYAGPDLAVAYIGDPAAGVSGRAIVWPERKIFDAQYGDCSRMRILLSNAGYTRGSLDGARIRRIPAYDDGSFVVPWIDGVSNCYEDGGYLILGEGDISCDSTDGVAGDPGPRCDSCEERFDYGGVYVSGIGETWCESCAESTVTCELSGNCYPQEWCGMVTAYRLNGWDRTYLEELTATRSNARVDGFIPLDGDLNSAEAWVSHEVRDLLQTISNLAAALDAWEPRLDPDALVNLAWETMALEALQAAPERLAA